jgi:hypothetical protein
MPTYPCNIPLCQRVRGFPSRLPTDHYQMSRRTAPPLYTRDQGTCWLVPVKTRIRIDILTILHTPHGCARSRHPRFTHHTYTSTYLDVPKPWVLTLWLYKPLALPVVILAHLKRGGGKEREATAYQELESILLFLFRDEQRHTKRRASSFAYTWPHTYSPLSVSLSP